MYLMLLLLGGLAFGQIYDPEPLDPDPERMPRRWVPFRVLDAQKTRPSQPAKPRKVAENAESRHPRADGTVPRRYTRVAVLGYHNFSKDAPVSEMMMRTSEFREQMEYIRKEGLTVISMQEFLEWRFGARDLPAKCVLITIDDGWKSVYTEAFPILKEYKYPFTIFLYTDFLSGRGESMSPTMIREMMKNGATVGSHSVHHYYPSSWEKCAEQGEQAYTKMVDEELGESRRRLSRSFGTINTYCYPGGYATQPMLDRIPSYGYAAAFTVVPGKVTCEENPWMIHRYMVFGNDPSIFKNAMDFRVAEVGKVVSTGSTPGTLPVKTPPPPFPVSPQPGSTVPIEVPEITADLSGVPGINLGSVNMKVSGFGRVPAKMDKATRIISWTSPCRIYMPNISVHLTWTSSDGTSHKAEWSFQVDQGVPVQQ